jgi:hypothetical protein
MQYDSLVVNADLESRDNEQAASDRNRVLQKSDYEVGHFQTPDKARARLITGICARHTSGGAQQGANDFGLIRRRTKDGARKPTHHYTSDESHGSLSTGGLRELVHYQFDNRECGYDVSDHRRSDEAKARVLQVEPLPIRGQTYNRRWRTPERALKLCSWADSLLIFGLKMKLGLIPASD